MTHYIVTAELSLR